MKLKAVTFDLWLTLIWDSKELEEYRQLRRLVNFHRFTRRIGSRGSIRDKISYNSVRLALEQLSIKMSKIYEKGLDLSPKDRGRMLFEILGVKFSRSEGDRIYIEAGRTLSDSGYYSRYPSLNSEAVPTLALLKKRFPHLKIGLISNAARSEETYKRMFRHFGILSYFDNLTISCEVGYLKPRKEIFEHALRHLEVDASETLHVGDLFGADIVGAASAGMNSLLYTGLWHRYAQYMNPAERIPKDFKSKNGTFTGEVSNLTKVGSFVGRS